MVNPISDNADDLRAIEDLLLPGEAIEAVFNCYPPPARTFDHRHLLGITSQRVIDYTYEEGIEAMCNHVSIPYSRIRTVQLDNEFRKARVQTRGGWRPVFEEFACKDLVISVVGSGDHEFALFGSDDGRKAHDLILSHLL